MTDIEALEAFARNERLDQPTIRQLLDGGLIKASGITTLDTPPGQQEYLPIAMTLKGQRLLDKAHNQAQNNRGKSKKNKRFQWLKKWVARFEIKAALALVPLLALYLTYKYTGADDLRSKVYSPLNAELSKVEGTLNANSVTQPFTSTSLASLKQSGDFYRMPKSLQREVSSFYDDSGQLQGNVAAVIEMSERQLSTRIEAIRTEASDHQWSQEVTYRIRAEELQKPGTSAIRSFTYTHTFRGRAMDVRDPNNPIISGPGGPIWEINDWLTYPESVEKVGAIWTDDDYLYFDESRDLWYYRITRYDLQQQHATLKDFLEPVHQALQKDDNFKAIQSHQPELLKRLERLKATFADRMDNPKRLMDLLD